MFSEAARSRALSAPPPEDKVFFAKLPDRTVVRLSLMASFAFPFKSFFDSDVDGAKAANKTCVCVYFSPAILAGFGPFASSSSISLSSWFTSILPSNVLFDAFS